MAQFLHMVRQALVRLTRSLEEKRSMSNEGLSLEPWGIFLKGFRRILRQIIKWLSAICRFIMRMGMICLMRITIVRTWKIFPMSECLKMKQANLFFKISQFTEHRLKKMLWTCFSSVIQTEQFQTHQWTKYQRDLIVFLSLILNHINTDQMQRFTQNFSLLTCLVLKELEKVE